MTPARLEELRQMAAAVDGPKSAWMDELISEVDRLNLQIDELKKKNVWLQQHFEMAEHMKDVYSNLSEKRQEIIDSQRKVVDAAVEWWADPHDTTKTIVDLQNAVEAYWEKHKNEKR